VFPIINPINFNTALLVSKFVELREFTGLYVYLQGKNITITRKRETQIACKYQSREKRSLKE